MSTPSRYRVCPKTGLNLTPARGQDGWRVAQERYTRSGGILAVRANEHIGPLPHDVADRRGRFDTIGRTVYFAEQVTTAFAEVLQPFRAARVALQADADAIGVTVEKYVADDGEAPGHNDPKTIEDGNVDGAPFRAVTTDWQLEVLRGRPRY